jgi:hypothetical protein
MRAVPLRVIWVVSQIRVISQRCRNADWIFTLELTRANSVLAELLSRDGPRTQRVQR